jgi:uncharacterized protein (DUF58 family)
MGSLAVTRRLAIVAAAASLLLVAVARDEGSVVWPLLALNVGLLVLSAVDGLLAVPASRLSIDRRLAPIVALGVTSPVEWRVANRSNRAVRFWMADDFAPSLRATTRRIGARVPKRGAAEAHAEIRPARRGLFRIDRVALRVAGPLGIGARQSTVIVPGELRVYPSFHSRDEAELRINRARILEVGLRSAQGRGGGTDFDQMREYTVDDEFRRIDWAATARAGKAMVRSYRAERNQTVITLLDNGRIMAGRVDDVPRVEHAMDAVMTLTTVATRLGDRCGFVAFDSIVRRVVVPTRGRDQLGRITEAMYELEPALVESDYRGAFTETLARFRRRALLVVLTDLVEQAVGEWLLPSMPMIARSHVVIVAAVRDPDVARWAAAPPDDPSEAYRQAAAVSAIAERARAAARLRGLGATVIDAEPGTLAPALADAYLSVKATGKL